LAWFWRGQDNNKEVSANLTFLAMNLKFSFRQEYIMNRTSTVSAVIISHNRPHFLKRAVISALAQKYSDLDVVVVVNGADGATEKMLAGIADKRLRVIIFPVPIGAAKARNLGVTSAWGDWIGFMTDEDEWLPEKTALQMEVARSSKYLYPIVTSQFIVRASREEVAMPATVTFQGLSEIQHARDSSAYSEGLLSTITMLFLKDLYAHVPVREIPGRNQDLDWMLRMIEHAGAGIEFVGKPLAVGHTAGPDRGVNVTVDWKSSFEWLESVRETITRRAYAGFIITRVAPLAARQGALRELPFLLNRMLTYGTPTAHDIRLFLGMLCSHQ
jgi:glycosyltransferase involved in cell wall biosynthesis